MSKPHRLPNKHLAVWRFKLGSALTHEDDPVPKSRPSAWERDARLQWDFSYFVFKLGQFFAQYNKAMKQSNLDPYDQRVIDVLSAYRAFVRNPYVETKYAPDQERGSAIVIANIVVVPTVDSDGYITSFLAQAIFPVGPGTPDDYSSSSSSRLPYP